MLVEELIDFLESYGPFDCPVIQLNGEIFAFTVAGTFIILGPEQNAMDMRTQLEDLFDSTELTTAVQMKVKVC